MSKVVNQCLDSMLSSFNLTVGESQFPVDQAHKCSDEMVGSYDCFFWNPGYPSGRERSTAVKPEV